MEKRLVRAGWLVLAVFGVWLGGFASAQETALESDSVRASSAPRAQMKPAAGAEKSPGTAVLLSFLVPGAGQVYAGRWWKACIIAPAEITLGVLSVRDHLQAMSKLRAGDEEGYLVLRNRRNVFLWWTGAVLAFSMADAYVSAQMYGFDRQMQFTLRPGQAGVAVAW